MNEDFCFKLIGKMPSFDEVLSIVKDFDEAKWSLYKDRKNRGGIAAEKSDTIPLLYNSDPSSSLLIYHEDFEVFGKHLESVVEMCKYFFGEVGIKQAMLTRLSSGSEIKRHKDKGPITSRSHRIHVPIITNTECVFTVAEEQVHMNQGQIWAIDNVGKYHSVKNGGNTDRVHLIIDVI
jgi:hypothetical protein